MNQIAFEDLFEEEKVEVAEIPVPLSPLQKIFWDYLIPKK